MKVLIAAASTALEKEEQLTELMEPGESGKYKEPKDTAGEDGGGRKMKSLAILCKRFSIFLLFRFQNGMFCFASAMNNIVIDFMNTIIELFWSG